MDPNRPPAWRLAGAASSYLEQHAGDFVDWYPWGEEALERARHLDRLLFVSIGFAACHWCHVMAHESFQNAAVGAELSSLFVCVKVDREERPDVDDLYVRLVQEMTGSAGWPLTVFLTPDLKPVWGGTYLPPFAGRGGPGLLDVARSVAGAWISGPQRMRERAEAALTRLRKSQGQDLSSDLPADILDRSCRALLQDYDEEFGGFGGAPKFPRPQDLRLLLRHGRRTGDQAATDAALVSLERMAAGGIHDQLDGGFHRYSTDDAWQVPHFEKLLCDSALLVPAYLEGYQQSGRPFFASVARRACDWMVHQLGTEHGGLAAGLDADGAGGEGVHCTWTQDEMSEALGARRGGRAQEIFGADLEGHMEDGRSVLWLAEFSAAGFPAGIDPYAESELSELSAKLREVRRTRPAPARDELVVTGWNGLALTALARTYQLLEVDAHLAAARSIAAHLLDVAGGESAELHACTRGSQGFGRASLEDYAFVVQGFIDLYETDFDDCHLGAAIALTECAEERFTDPAVGGYFLAQPDPTPLPLRTKDGTDGALSAGHAVHALNLLRLGQLCSQGEWIDTAKRAIESVGVQLTRQPRRFSSLLIAHDHLESDPLEIVFAGAREDQQTQALLRAARRAFHPGKVMAFAHAQAHDALNPLLEGKAAAEAKAFVCRQWTCETPVTAADALADRLG